MKTTDVSRELEQARRHAELANFEVEEASSPDRVSTNKMENILAHAEEIFASAKSLLTGNERSESPEKREQIRTALISQVEAEAQKLA
jgi:hypothetical protein